MSAKPFLEDFTTAQAPCVQAKVSRVGVIDTHLAVRLATLGVEAIDELTTAQARELVAELMA